MPLGRPGGWGYGGAGGTSATPGWGYFFAGACGQIPIVTLGGCVPAAIGFSGAGVCLQLARASSMPTALRVAGCLVVTFGAWLLLAVFLVAMASAMRQ
jgi:hypothetical protein